MAPECLQFGLVGYALFTLAFGAQPETVDIAADPGVGVPVQGAAAFEVLVFELLDNHRPVDLLIMHLMTGQGREGGAAVGVSDRPQRCARCVQCLAVSHGAVVHAGMVHGRWAHAAVVHAAMVHGTVVHRAMIHALGPDGFTGQQGEQRQAAQQRAVENFIHRRVPRGTYPSPCGKAGGSGRPSAPARRR
ncbi:hypothetical protein D3C72_1667890 [compost metagenome]